jgi:hypothetical protein
VATDAERLAKFVGRGERVVVDWERAEGELGLALPPDYQALAENHPVLRLADFLTVFHPTGRTEFDTLLGYGLELTRAVRDVAADFPEMYPYAVYPDPGGLLCWGVTDNGDQCYWLTVGDPGSWPVVIGDDDHSWRFDGTVTGFLLGLLEGTVRCPLFPDLAVQDPGNASQAE